MKLKLEDFIKYEQPGDYIVDSDQYNDSFKIPVLTAGQSFLLGYTNENYNIYNDLPVILFDDFTTSVQYVDFPFKVKSSAMKLLKNSDEADIKFCYYLLKYFQKQPENHKRQWISTTSKISIELPQLKEQKDIIDTLDKLTNIINKHNTQLNLLDELVKARFVEMFGDPVLNSYGWKKVILKNICTKLNDGTHSSPKSYEIGDYKYVTAKNIKQSGFDFTNITYVSEEVHRSIYERCNPEYGDVLYIKDGATTGIAMVNTLEEEFTLLSSVALLKQDRNIINGVFLASVLNNKEMYESIRRNMGGAAITRLTIAKLNKIKIILPPLTLQNQFADFVREVDKSRLKIQKSLESTQELFDSLMQKYFG